MMGVAPDPKSPQFDLPMTYSLSRRCTIHPEDPGFAAGGECCAPAPDQHPSPLREEAPTAAGDRPSPVGLALPRLDGRAFVAGHRQTRNSRRLAPQGVWLLDVGGRSGEAKLGGLSRLSKDRQLFIQRGKRAGFAPQWQSSSFYAVGIRASDVFQFPRENNSIDLLWWGVAAGPTSPRH